MKIARTMIRSVANIAEMTFRPSNSEKFKENLDSLAKLMAQLKPSHVGLPENQIKPMIKPYHGVVPTALTMHIHETEDYSMGVFILDSSQKIPLHDHPSMFGLIKCIQGKMQVRSYTRLVNKGDCKVPPSISSRLTENQVRQLIPCKFEGSKIVDANDAVCSLNPEVGNIHEIKALGEPAIFIDILSPPYDGQGRECNYYYEISSNEMSEISWLISTPPPPEFWTVPVNYVGPIIE